MKWTDDYWGVKKPINESQINVKCANCGYHIRRLENVFEGIQPSYICPKCGYEGYVTDKKQKELLR